MTAKSLTITLALALMAAVTGCKSWCEQHYPCQQAQAACVPCCPPTTGAAYSPPVTAPVPVAQNWGNPAGAPGGCTCTCTRNP